MESEEDQEAMDMLVFNAQKLNQVKKDLVAMDMLVFNTQKLNKV